MFINQGLANIYASGVIFIHKLIKLYALIGTKSLSNAVSTEISCSNVVNSYGTTGGATVIKLDASNKWYDNISLTYRIIVAG